MPNFMIPVVIAVVILLIAGILVLVAFLVKRRTEEPTDFRAFLMFGIIFLPLGIIWTAMSQAVTGYPVIGMPFLVMGILYLMIGLANRRKLVKQEVPLSTTRTSVLAIAIVSILVFLILTVIMLGILTYQ